jgi:hypothetical protein
MSRVKRGAPNLFTIPDRSRLPPRTRTIANFIANQSKHTGQIPSIEEVARTFAMSQTRVVYHFKLLGIAQQ